MQPIVQTKGKHPWKAKEYHASTIHSSSKVIEISFLYVCLFGILFLISRKYKFKCSQLCKQRANIREKEKNITLVQFTVVVKGYKNLDYICLYDLGCGTLFLISRKQKLKCRKSCIQKANICEKQKNITLVQFTVVQKNFGLYLFVWYRVWYIVLDFKEKEIKMPQTKDKHPWKANEYQDSTIHISLLGTHKLHWPGTFCMY